MSIVHVELATIYLYHECSIFISNIVCFCRFNANVERRDHCDNTTLHYAMASDNPKLVQWLIEDKNMIQFINTRNRVMTIN